MNEPVKDEVGTLDSKDVGTTPTAGMIGPARHLAGRQGIFGGEKIANYPVGCEFPQLGSVVPGRETECDILAWGNEQAQGKVVMQFRSPPHVTMDCYFSEGERGGGSTLPCPSGFTWSTPIRRAIRGSM